MLELNNKIQHEFTEDYNCIRIGLFKVDSLLHDSGIS